MGHIKLTVAEIKRPAEGKDRGNIIGVDGTKLGCFREKLGQSQIGSTYDIEHTDGDYKNVKSAKLIAAAGPAAQQAATAPAANGGGNGHYRPTCPQDAERMLVTSWGHAFIRTGQIEPNEEQVVKMITILRRAYQRTLRLR